LTSAAILVESLRARGVEIRVVGDRIRCRPAAALSPEELAALIENKPEILRLLAPEPAPSLALDPVTVHEVLGANRDEHDLGILRLEILAAVRQLEIEIATGVIDKRVRMVRGRPLADWLTIDDIAMLLRSVRDRR
jgi:predicted Zn-dependent protease